MENTTTSQESKQEKMHEKTGLAILAYLVFFVPLLSKDRNDPFVKYHTKQGIILFNAAVVAAVFGQAFPIIGHALAPVLNLAIIVLAIIGIYHVSQKEQKPLPFIGHLASSFWQ